MRTLFSLLIVTVLSGCFSASMAQGQYDYSGYHPISTGVFANFTFPAHPGFGTIESHNRKSIKLRNGLFRPTFNERGDVVVFGAYLKSVDFKDVTNDGRKEAIVTLGNLCHCSGEWYAIYIYRMAGRRALRLLWSFYTGDRAVGGLRRIYVQRDSLVVELYGIGSGPSKLPKDYHGASCCTVNYTHRRYRWNGKRFIQQGKSRLLIEPEARSNNSLNRSAG